MTTYSARGLWLACAVLLSTIVGIGGGVLSFIGGDNPAKAVVAGAATFAGTMALVILVLTFIASPGRADPGPPNL
jgi:hypothetical protein